MQRTPSHRRQTTSTQKVTGGQGTSQTGKQVGTPSGRQSRSGHPKGSGPVRGVAVHQILVDNVNTFKECLLCVK